MTATPLRPPLKCLTVHQPWAFLLAWGLKDVENRGLEYRWPHLLGIHASQTVDKDAYGNPLVTAAITGWVDASDDRYLTALAVPPWEQTGQVLSVAEGLTGHRAGTVPQFCTPNSPCSAWGQPGAGVWHHRTTRMTRLPEPVPALGAQRLWTPAPDVADAIHAGYVDAFTGSRPADG